MLKRLLLLRLWKVIWYDIMPVQLCKVKTFDKVGIISLWKVIWYDIMSVQLYKVKKFDIIKGWWKVYPIIFWIIISKNKFNFSIIEIWE